MMIASIWLQRAPPCAAGERNDDPRLSGHRPWRRSGSARKLLQRYGARLPMMAGPVLAAIAIGLTICTFTDKALYIGVVTASNVQFGLGLGCYATPSTDTAVQRAGEQIGVASGSTRWAARWKGDGHCRDGVTFRAVLPLGMAHAAQYALWFNAALCLGAMAVKGKLLLPRTSHS